MEEAHKGSVPDVGDRVQIWWPHDQAFYAGLVHSYNQQDATHFIKYDDGETEYLDMKNERWRRLNDAPQHKQEPSIQPPPGTSAPKSKAEPTTVQDPAPGSTTLTPRTPSQANASPKPPQLKSQEKTQPKPQTQQPTPKKTTTPPRPSPSKEREKHSTQAQPSVPSSSPKKSTPTPSTAATSSAPAASEGKTKKGVGTGVGAPAASPLAPSPKGGKSLNRDSNGKLASATATPVVLGTTVAGAVSRAPDMNATRRVEASAAPTAHPETTLKKGTSISGSNKRSAPSGVSTVTPSTGTATVAVHTLNVPKKKMRTEHHPGGKSWSARAPEPAVRVLVPPSAPSAAKSAPSAARTVAPTAPAPAPVPPPPPVLPSQPRVRVRPPAAGPGQTPGAVAVGGGTTAPLVRRTVAAPPALPVRGAGQPRAPQPMQGVTMVPRGQPPPQAQQARRNGTPLERCLDRHINEVVKVQRSVTTLHSMYRDLMKQMRVENGDGVRRANLLQAEVESMRTDLRRLLDGQHDLHNQIGYLHERMDNLAPRPPTTSSAAPTAYVPRPVYNQSYTAAAPAPAPATNYYDRGYDERNGAVRTVVSAPMPAPAHTAAPARRVSADRMAQSETIVARAKADALNLGARQVMIWLLETDHECRSADVGAWAAAEATKCMERVAFLLGKFTEYDHALRVLSDSLGLDGAQLLWFTDSPTADNLRLARKNYDVWDPPPTDAEWMHEIKLLGEVHRRFKHALERTEVSVNDSHLQVTINVAAAAITNTTTPTANGAFRPPEPPRIPNNSQQHLNTNNPAARSQHLHRQTEPPRAVADKPPM